jgi:hypothetical protein
MLLVWIGDDRYFGMGEQWVALPESTGSRSPLWVLDALPEPPDDPEVRLVVNDEGYVGSVSWSPRRGVRRRGGLLRHDSGERRPWETLELWDYGIDVDIPVPVTTAVEPVSKSDLARIPYEFWKARRDWRREH